MMSIDLPDFEAFLKEAMGLDASSLVHSAVGRAVLHRQMVCRLDEKSYWGYLRATPAEIQELIEAVVVPETWFFRDKEAFVALSELAMSMLLKTPALHEIKLLSLPCSSGEEPYSMAVALLENGIPPAKFSVDAIDISKRVLDLAKNAIYGNNSFRGEDIAFRSRHFKPVDGKWRLDSVVRKKVKFEHGNLFAPDFLPCAELYDFIFCRNVLIYFDKQTQNRAIEVLLRLLRPNGFLFVAPSETGLLPKDKFVSAKIPMAFAFQYQPATITTNPVKETLLPTVSSFAPDKRRHPSVPPKKAIAKLAPTKPAQARFNTEADNEPSKNDLLEKAKIFANQGRMPEAATSCELYLKNNGTSAEAYCLLGIIMGAGGDNKEALALYRKAIYLDPEHAESLSHLVLVLEKLGDQQGAKLIRERLLRLQSGDDQ